MKSKKYISIILTNIFVLLVILFLSDAFTKFEIKNQTIKSFVYIGILILTPLVIIWNIVTFKFEQNKIFIFLFSVMIFIGILIIDPIKIIFSSSTWKTQTILYQNKRSKFKKIEFQMRDMGVLGYKRRTVEVTYIMDLFIIVKSVEDDVEKRIEWIKINKDINELGLKGP